MARNAWTVQQIVDEGLAPTFTAAPAVIDGLSIPGTGDIFIEVKNGSASPINVTIQTGGTLMGEPVADKVVSVPATTGDCMIGPFPPALYNQADGLVYVDFSAVATVTVGAFRR